MGSGTSPRTPGSGGSLKIGRRSTERSKSPFRSFRWRRSTSRAVEFDDDDEGNDKKTQTKIDDKRNDYSHRLKLILSNFNMKPLRRKFEFRIIETTHSQSSQIFLS